MLAFLCKPWGDFCLVNFFVGYGESLFMGSMRLLSFSNWSSDNCLTIPPRLPIASLATTTCNKIILICILQRISISYKQGFQAHTALGWRWTSPSVSLPSATVSAACELSSDTDVSSAGLLDIACTDCQTALAASASAADASLSFSREYLSKLVKSTNQIVIKFKQPCTRMIS